MVSPSSAFIKLSNRQRNPRKNFGTAGSRRRTEAKFLRSFEQAYFGRIAFSGVAAGEFSLSGFGIADLVWISWTRKSAVEEFTALSLEKELNRRHLFAFEGKIKNWRRALQQAFRYRYFADKAIVVMPYSYATAAIKNLEAFRHAAVGLWTLDPSSNIIREHYTPRAIRAFNPDARAKAIRMLASKIKFGQLCEHVKTVIK